MSLTRASWRPILGTAALAGALMLAGCASTPSPDSPVSTGQTISLNDAFDRMMADGSLNTHVFTKKRPGGRMDTPKYADRSWNWFVERRLPLNSPERALPEFYRERAYDETLQKNMDRTKLNARMAAWTPINITGDVQPSGRMVELAVHPTNDQIVYAATASGGVFKTTDRGATWANVTDGFLPTNGIGSLAMDPNDPNTLYVGLGEGVPGSHYEPYGAGVYKTTNAGNSWAKVNGTDNFAFATDIAVMNNSSTILVAAAGSITGSAAGGVFRTTNGGTSWDTISTAPAFCISVDASNRNNVVLTTKGTQAANASIFYSTNAGASFTASTTPANTGAFRIEVSRNGNTCYALVGGGDASLLGIWKSTNGGQSWSALPMTGVPTSGDFKPGQMYYNNSIQVSPFDPNLVYFGSNLRLYRSTDGGNNWAARSDWAGEGLPYVHADHHSIRFGANSNTVYYGTDGGFFVTTDGSNTWNERNVGMTALQLYRMDNHPTNANALIMGLQDNDKYVRRANGTWHHYPNSFGDAMEVIAHPSNTNTFMGCNYYGSAIRITEDAGATAWPFLRGYGQNNNGIPDAEQGAWVSPFFYDPKAPNTLYLGLNAIYRTTYTPGQYPQWQQIIGPTTGFNPAQMEAMAITMGNTNRKLVGFLGRRSDSGLAVGFWRANTDGTNYEQLSLPQQAWVADIEADPNNNDTIWIVYSDINNNPGSRGRIYKSTNLGTTWVDMTNDFPRNLPASAIMVDPQNSNTIFVGSDIGVYRSDNGGQNWVYWNDGMPVVVVTDFSYFGPDRKIRVATYGRGIFESLINPPAGNPDIRVSPETLNFN